MKNIIALAFASVVSMVSPIMAEVHLGDQVPGTIALTTWDGTTTNLDAYKGKFVVLEWYNPECPFVKKHYSVGNMQSLQKEFTAQGVVWLTVNSSAPGKQGSLNAEQAKELMTTANGAPTSVVLDHSGAFGKALGAKTTPHMFIIDKSGKLVYRGAIDDNDSARSATIAGAKNFVRAALNELMNDKPVSVANTDSYGCSVKYSA